MCGIACLIRGGEEIDRGHFAAMVDSVSHRGPDGRGEAYFGGAGLAPTENDGFELALGHRRLSILDLSEAGAQPMSSADGDLVISYNGEVYNYIELREELRRLGHFFKSNCDTEVILAAYREWGAACVERFNGMWAFAILERSRRRLFVSRDRIGIKPLYCRVDGGFLAIASEIKQFLRLPGIEAKPNDAVCLSYLATGYERPPETFFAGIAAFPPGHRAMIDIDNPAVNPEKFWFPENVEPILGDPAELAERIGAAVAAAVRLRLRSDVPVGGCLSGGLDSSAIFMLMKEAEPDAVFAAFSSCFDDAAIDERPFMRAVVEATNSEHYQVFPDAEGLAADFDSFLRQHDEPVGSVSMYAQYRVMRRARGQSVPVLLDGQGGDELFSGYWPAYLLMLNRMRRDGRYGALLGQLLGACLPGGNPGLLGAAFTHFFDYRRRAARVLPFDIKSELKTELPEWHAKAQELSPREYRLAEITKVHLPRLLKWEDRNSMAYSIESRVPFLDVNLIELVLSIQPEMNMSKGWNKALFRRAMSGKLPDKIRLRRDKMGFETPQQAWMRRGAFRRMLDDWAASGDFAIDRYVNDTPASIAAALNSEEYDSTAMFRLFCLDKWLRDVVGA